MSASNVMNELKQMSAGDVVRNGLVREQFISVYNSIWQEGGEHVYEREAIYFNQQLRDKKDLLQCTAISVYYCFIDLAVKGLTLAPGSQALCYLLAKSKDIGTDRNGNVIYEKICNLTISAYGELVLRTRAGQIRHADNPVIVYEGDTFQFGEQNGHKVVNYMSAFPRTSNKITACFMKITRADGSVDYAVITEADWKRLEYYSEKNNGMYKDFKTGQMVKKGANSLYTVNNGQIDTGFLIAKCIKHAFKTYPKLKIGKGMMLESEMPELQEQQDGFDPYGGVESHAPAKQEAFGPAVDTSTGVIIEEENKGEYDGAF